jgi:hypothetical protein
LIPIFVFVLIGTARRVLDFLIGAIASVVTQLVPELGVALLFIGGDGAEPVTSAIVAADMIIVSASHDEFVFRKLVTPFPALSVAPGDGRTGLNVSGTVVISIYIPTRPLVIVPVAPSLMIKDGIPSAAIDGVGIRFDVTAVTVAIFIVVAKVVVTGAGPDKDISEEDIDFHHDRRTPIMLMPDRGLLPANRGKNHPALDNDIVPIPRNVDTASRSPNIMGGSPNPIWALL